MKTEEALIDFVIFETERLFIREFNIDDVDAVYAYAGNVENTVFMDWGPDSFDDVRNFIDSRLRHQISSPRTSYDFAICLKATGALIGGMGLYLDEKRMQGELGYTLHRDFWGKGYATEAALGFLKFGFMSLDLHRIHAKCDSENLASEGVMKRIGMRKEGETKSSCYTRVHQREQWRGVKYYAMLQKEYLNRLFDD